MPTHRETVRLVVRLQRAGLVPTVIGGAVVVSALTKAQSEALASAIADAAVTEG
jgi:hypothetical protein